MLFRSGIDVAIVEPAAVASSFTASVDRYDGGPYQAQLDAYIQRTTASFAQAQAAEDAAKTVIEAAITETPKFRWQTSEAAVRFAGLPCASGWGETPALLTFALHGARTDQY